MDLSKTEESLKKQYRETAAAYRKHDDVHVVSKSHRATRQILENLSLSFGRPIRVLDAGCGTGRNFHCLKNVQRLVAADVSPEMLEQARHPVRPEEISAHQIELIRANIFSLNFPSQSFHLIYSLGVFGHGCPVTLPLCNQFHDWLVPDGQLFFDTIDLEGIPKSVRLRKQFRDLLYTLFPNSIKAILDERAKFLPLFAFSKRQLEQLLRQSRFESSAVQSRPCFLPKEKGRKLECIAWKSFQTVPATPPLFAAPESSSNAVSTTARRQSHPHAV
jgi:SAM-dependent methyltransferase